MENFEDRKEDLLDNIEPVLNGFYGSERRANAKEIIRIASFFGTKTQTPVDSIPEAIDILQEIIWEDYSGCEVQGNLRTFSLS